MSTRQRRWPKYYQQYLRTFERMIAKRQADGKKNAYGRHGGHTAQDVMDWWLSDQPRPNKAQGLLFDD